MKKGKAQNMAKEKQRETQKNEQHKWPFNIFQLKAKTGKPQQ